MNERQLEFNFPAWSQREDMITRLDFAWHLRLPQYSCHCGQVPPETLASVLAHIGKYPECYESQERICQRLKIHERKLQRAIAVLRVLDILTTERKPIRQRSRETFNHHRINWEQVRRLINRQTTNDQPDSSVGLIVQKSGDQPDSTVAINPTVLTDQPDSTVAINPTVLSPSLLERELECEREESEFNTPPPNPPPLEASQVDQCQEEEEGSSRLISIPFALIRTEKPTAEAPGVRHRAVAAELQAEQDPEAVFERSAEALAVRSTEADLVRRYRQANVYDAEQLIDRLLPEVGSEYLYALLAFWLTNQTSFEGAGALRLRLKRSRPDLPIADGWPPMRQKPPIPRVKSAETHATEREAYLRARAEAQLVASVEPSMGEQLRARRAAMLTGNSVDPEGLRVCTQAPAGPQWSGPTECSDRGRAAEACP